MVIHPPLRRLRPIALRHFAALACSYRRRPRAIRSSPPAAAATAQLPFTITNNSGRGDAAYIYVMARNPSTGQQGCVNSSGAWVAFSFPTSIRAGQPSPAAPDISIGGPRNSSKVITLPPNLSGGRIYVSMGAKLQFFLTTNGLVEPAPRVATDPNHDILYDWTEFARVGPGHDHRPDDPQSRGRP